LWKPPPPSPKGPTRVPKKRAPKSLMGELRGFKSPRPQNSQKMEIGP